MKKPIRQDRIRNLLVRGVNWVGDSVISIPALNQIRKSFPDAHICLLVLPWVSGVYEGSELVDEILLYDRSGKHRGISGKVRLIQELRKRRFDAAILFQNAFEAALLTALAGIPVRIGYRRDARGWLLSHALAIDPRLGNLHQAYYYLDLVNQVLGQKRVLEDALQWKLPLSTELHSAPWLVVSHPRKEAARQLLRESGISFSKPVIGVNPGASFGSAKRWPKERYAALLDRLTQQPDNDIVLFGSESEVSLAQTIRAGMRRPPLILSGKTTLSELIALISCCDLFITNDSGPMHLAAALGVPMLAIFGPTDEIATGPMSKQATVVKKKVECSPCLLRECPIDHRCMTEISVEELYRQAIRTLQTTKGSASLLES